MYRDSEKQKAATKKWRENNRAKTAQYAKKDYVNNRKRIDKYQKEYREKNKARLAEYSKGWRTENLPKTREYMKKRRKYDLQFRLREILRTRQTKALEGNYKIGSFIRDLGCTISELKFYLEGKFTDGMSWENYGHDTWHIDHMVPLAMFDLSDRQQFLQACHYTNLQPMWAIENLRKSKKVTKIV